jgi:hypothetical protein
MIVYYSTPYKIDKVLNNLQNKRTTNSNPANFLACPAVRDSWHNVFMFSLLDSTSITYDNNLITSTNEVVVKQEREPHLLETNIFKIDSPSYFFAESPLKIKVTAPYFHNVSYQSKGTFIGGVFDIGRWFRPIQSEIITWQEKGTIEFEENEPVFYVEFLTDETVSLQRFGLTPTIEFLAESLINSPFQNKENLQGSLETRYQAFEQSDFRLGLLEEIKLNLVSEDEPSQTV